MPTDKRLQSLSKLLVGISVPSIHKDKLVEGLSLDSRKVKKGYLFFAINGEKNNGSNFIGEAIKNGAIFILTDQESASITSNIVYLANLSKEIGLISSRFYGNPSSSLELFCATGTNGKTSYVELTSNIARKLGIKSGYISTINYSTNENKLFASSLTTPDPINLNAQLSKMVTEGCKLGAIEASSHGLVQNRLSGIKINMAVLTSFSHDHLDYHETLENYALAKRSLFVDLDVEIGLINIDSNFGYNLYKELKDIGKKIYSISKKREADFKVIFKKNSFNYTELELISIIGNINFKVNTFSKMIAFNSALALSSLGLKGIPLKNIAGVMSQLIFPEGRMELIKINKVSSCIVDFAHTPDALLQSLQEIKESIKGELWCLFGCGGNRDVEKRTIMGSIAEELSDRVILTNDNPREEAPMTIIKDILSGMVNPSLAVIEEDREKAIYLCVKEIYSSKKPINLLIAGKGHEKHQLIGNKYFKFNDKQVVLSTLKIL